VLVGISALFFFGCNSEVSQSHWSLIDSAHSNVKFNNILKETEELNYFTYPYLYMGGGVAVGDINNDGLDDIFFTGNMVSNRLYLNKGNFQFEDITTVAKIGGDDRWYSGATMVDINADGYLDIYVSVSGKDKTTKNQLFVNNGDQTFSEQAASYGLDDAGKSVQSTFFDYDRDGDLDLYVANYPIASFATPNELYRRLMDEVTLKDSDHLYRNEGNGKFTDVTVEAQVLSYGLSLSATIGDLNNDGWDDLYVSNDFSTPDYMYINNRDGSFREVLKESTKQTAFYGMGVDISDYNNDGMLDIMQVDMAAEDNRRAKANMASMNPDLFWSTVDYDMHYQYMYNALQLNRGNNNDSPLYSNVNWVAGVATTDWSWAPLFADFDNDGWKDLFVSNGTRRDINNRDFFLGLKKNLNKISNEELKLEVENIPSEPIANYIFKNNKDLSFSDVTDLWGIDQLEGFSNGVSYSDLNNDGRLDLIVNNIDEPAHILKNELADASNYLSIRLKQPEDNVRAIGTKIQLKSGGQTQHQYLTLTRGFQSSVPPTLHFGLGEATIVDTILIVWPDGYQEVVTNVPVNQQLEIIKGTLDDFDSTVSSSNHVFTEVNQDVQLPDHVENIFDDFKFQILLPHKMSQWGPALATSPVEDIESQDLYLGAASRSTPGVYTYNGDGSFELKQAFESDNLKEDIDAVFVDIDNDQDLDLYVVSGGYELPYKDQFYGDRLYINDEGNYRLFDDLPKVLSSGACVRPYDYDNDGDIDIFVGGRLSPANYPKPGTSYLLENKLETGTLSFDNVTERVIPDVADIGMVTDALWTDYEQDGDIDLVVVGEWMPISVLINSNGTFRNLTQENDLEHTRGWWFSIEQADLDNDGDIDFVVGNLGENYKYQASDDATFDLYASDFDKNSTLDIVLGYYNDDKQYPVRGRQCSSDQIPGIKRKFENYESFAIATITDIYGDDEIESAEHFSVQDFSSILMINEGHGKYVKQELPQLSQLSSINDILIKDFNKDAKLDILLAGNLYTSEVETPRADAGIGLLMLGDGELNFKPLSFNESGLLLNHDVKKLAVINSPDADYLLAASNNGPVIIHKY